MKDISVEVAIPTPDGLTGLNSVWPKFKKFQAKAVLSLHKPPQWCYIKYQTKGAILSVKCFAELPHALPASHNFGLYRKGSLFICP
jgi:hypothetical protein